MDDEDKKYLSMLPVGQGVVKLQDRWRQPFLVKVPLVNVRKGAVPDEVLRSYLREEITLSALKRLVDQESGGEGQFRPEDSVLIDKELLFLKDILKFKDDGVDVRYKRLGVSADKGNKLKMSLVAKNVIEEQRVSCGRTRKVLLRMTGKARGKLWRKNDERG